MTKCIFCCGSIDWSDRICSHCDREQFYLTKGKYWRHKIGFGSMNKESKPCEAGVAFLKDNADLVVYQQKQLNKREMKEISETALIDRLVSKALFTRKINGMRC